MLINGKDTEEMGLDELRTIQTALNLRWSRIQQERKQPFTKGQKVAWVTRGGEKHEGTVTRRNPRTLTVREQCTDGKVYIWKISYARVWDVNAKNMNFTHLKGKTA